MRGIIVFTDNGKILADKIKENDDKVYINKEINGGVKSILDKIFNLHSEIIFICATGIAVRLIAPYLKSKLVDPAIIVLDDMGNFVIPLVSGHIGGANILALSLSKKINATPVITTASDNRGFKSLDLYFKENDVSYINKEMMTKVMGDMVNNKKVLFINISSRNIKNIDYEKATLINGLDNDFNNIELSTNILANGDKDISSIIIVADTKNKADEFIIQKLKGKLVELEKSQGTNLKILICVIKNLNIGMGLKRGKSFSELYSFLQETLLINGYTKENILTLNSIDIKKDEDGLKALSEELNIKFNFYDEDTLNNILNNKDIEFTESTFVKSITGVSNVCETSALVNGGDLIVKKTAKDGMTIAISKISE